MKPSKPGTKRPSPDTEVNTGIKKIPCYSKLNNQTPLDYAVTFLFGGVRVEAAVPCGRVSDISTDNFKTDANGKNSFDHIESGDQGGGWHIKSTGTNNKIVEITRTGNNGVYEAIIDIDGVRKPTNGGKSTFFPDD